MGKKRILLVDDSETILVLEKLMLGSDYDLITAKNGRLALETAIREKPDLILMDIMMPEMDGIEALRAMRAFEQTQKIPIIMVTTKSDQDRVDTCYKLGCTDYINKPVNREELLNKVSKNLS